MQLSENFVKDKEDTEKYRIRLGDSPILDSNSSNIDHTYPKINPQINRVNSVETIQTDQFACLHCHAEINNNNIYNQHAIFDHYSSGITRSNLGQANDVCGVFPCERK
jgi:hypothetical protein